MSSIPDNKQLIIKFDNVDDLKKIEISGFDNLSYLFYKYPILIKASIYKWNVSNVKNMEYICFMNVEKLKD